jgi:hypothetical protein
MILKLWLEIMASIYGIYMKQINFIENYHKGGWEYKEI